MNVDFWDNRSRFLKPPNYERIIESERAVLATTAERQRASPPDTQTSTENWREKKLHSTSPTSEWSEQHTNTIVTSTRHKNQESTVRRTSKNEHKKKQKHLNCISAKG